MVFFFSTNMVDLEPSPCPWHLGDATSLSLHFAARQASAPQIWATAVSRPLHPGVPELWAEGAPASSSYQFFVQPIIKFLATSFDSSKAILHIVKVTDLLSAFCSSISHFSLRCVSLTFACSPSSPGWVSTRRGPSNSITSMLRRRSVRRRSKSFKR